MRVLVVEDERKTASFIRKALQAEGFAVDICNNGNDVAELTATMPFIAWSSMSCCREGTA